MSERVARGAGCYFCHLHIYPPGQPCRCGRSRSRSRSRSRNLAAPARQTQYQKGMCTRTLHYLTLRVARRIRAGSSLPHLKGTDHRYCVCTRLRRIEVSCSPIGRHHFSSGYCNLSLNLIRDGRRSFTITDGQCPNICTPIDLTTTVIPTTVSRSRHSEQRPIWEDASAATNNERYK